jgi:hypothetical protein
LSKRFSPRSCHFILIAIFWVFTTARLKSNLRCSNHTEHSKNNSTNSQAQDTTLLKADVLSIRIHRFIIIVTIGATTLGELWLPEYIGY